MKKYLLTTLIVALTTIYIPTSAQKKAQTTEIKILYTNDNHGWIEPQEKFGGAAGMYKHWKKNDKYKPSDSKFLVVSGGDLITGPAVSTWYKGESTVEVLNAMGFDLSAIGNHEFDLTPKGLEERSKQMQFPLVCANIEEKATGKIPSFATPYVIEQAGDLKIAFIGLSTLSTPVTTSPINVEPYNFIPYQEALNKYITEIEAKNPDIIFILAHFGYDESKELTAFCKQHKIPAILGGHFHERYIYQVNDIYLIQSGCYMQSYVSIPITYNKATKEVSFKNIVLYENTPIKGNKKIKNIVEKWQNKAQEDLTVEIGYNSKLISQDNPALCRFEAHAWMDKHPEAQIGFNNMGGVRQDLQPGSINMKTLIGLMPFDNRLVILTLTGQEVIEAFNGPEKLEAYGLIKQNGNTYKLKNGEILDPNKTYKIITTDYITSVTPSLKNAKQITHLNEPYRDAVVEFLKTKTSKEKPLDTYLE